MYNLRHFRPVFDRGNSTESSAMPYAHWWMECQNPKCGLPIQLPDPATAVIKPGLEEWPKRGWRRAFLCFQCGHSFLYSSANVRLSLDATRNPYEVIPFATHCIRFECAEGNCETQVGVYVVADAWTSSDAIAATYRTWQFHWDCPTEYLSASAHSPKPEESRISVDRCAFPA
jgi:hypothetical protein